MSLSAEIKELALNLGFCKAGITTADDFSPFITELMSRGNHYDYWINNPRNLVDGAKPKQLFPAAKSIIITAFDYAQKSYPSKLLPMIGRAYLSRSYLPTPDMINGARVRLLKEFLEKNGCTVDTDMYIPIRQAAARAGVTTFGRNNFAYVDGIGSFVILYAFIVDKELEYDSPTLECKCPDDCNACMKACPTGAIYAPFKLNPQRCMGFNNWMRQDGRGSGLDSEIPRDIREKIGIRVHGCDICQEVCPRNQAKIKANFPKDEFLELISNDFTLTSLLHMNREFYQTRVYPIMYNYIKDIKYFQRNAAIALGNTGDETYVPALAAELGNQEDLVRLHVAWALGKIGNVQAKKALEHHLATERSDKVKQEIRTALQ